MEADGYWDMGYEVCFYRDLLFELGSSVRPSGYSPKRTFDLCLFSERSIIVIEAKAFQCFDAEQAGHFQKDRAQIQKLVGREINVRLVALASSQRLNDSRWQDRTEALMPFDGYVTWAHVNERFPDPVFMRADSICGPTPDRSR